MVPMAHTGTTSESKSASGPKQAVATSAIKRSMTQTWPPLQRQGQLQPLCSQEYGIKGDSE
jgi:hypothetical protein